MMSAKVIKIPFVSDDLDTERARGKEISAWLKEQGLVIGRDFTWLTSNIEKEIHILLADENRDWETMLHLKYL